MGSMATEREMSTPPMLQMEYGPLCYPYKCCYEGSEWVSRVLRPARHIIGHFGSETSLCRQSLALVLTTENILGRGFIAAAAEGISLMYLLHRGPCMNGTLYSWTFKFHKVVRQQNSGAVKEFSLTYSAVYLRIQNWKNCWNWYTFAKVIVEIKVEHFYGPRCIIICSAGTD